MAASGWHGAIHPLARLWLGAMFVAPVYVGASLVPLSGWVVVSIAAVAGALAAARWAFRRARIVNGKWVYRGVLFEYSAPLEHLTLRPLDECNYVASCGGRQVTVYGFAVYPGPGFPGQLIEPDAAPGPGEEPTLRRRVARPSAPEIVAAIPFLFIAAMAIAY